MFFVDVDNFVKDLSIVLTLLYTGLQIPNKVTYMWDSTVVQAGTCPGWTVVWLETKRRTRQDKTR